MELNRAKIKVKGSVLERNSQSVLPVIPTTSQPSQPGIDGNITLFDLCKINFAKKKKEPRKKTESSKAQSSQKRLSTEPKTRSSGPRVEIVNGRIVIQESSLEIDQEGLGGFGDEDEGDYEEVTEDQNTSATYSSFLEFRRKGRQWGMAETELFYKALRQCGSDFSLMLSFLPGRSRREIVLKFRKEEKLHPELVQVTLSSSLPLDLSMFEVEGEDGKSGPGPREKKGVWEGEEEGDGVEGEVSIVPFSTKLDKEREYDQGEEVYEEVEYQEGEYGISEQQYEDTEYGREEEDDFGGMIESRKRKTVLPHSSSSSSLSSSSSSSSSVQVISRRRKGGDGEEGEEGEGAGQGEERRVGRKGQKKTETFKIAPSLPSEDGVYEV